MRWLGIGMLLVLAGCWNGGNTSVNLGSVSIGEQLIDLQRAHEAGAIDAAEYESARAAILAALSSLSEAASKDD